MGDAFLKTATHIKNIQNTKCTTYNNICCILVHIRFIPSKTELKINTQIVGIYYGTKAVNNYTKTEQTIN
jgi:predicted secreted protein